MTLKEQTLMKKIERILAIIILLLDRDTITTTELAEQFNVTKRTIFRDIETIELAGFPIIAKSGRHGGFSLMDSFKLRVLTFTKEEKELILKALTIKERLVGNPHDSTVIKEKIATLLDTSSTAPHPISLSSPTIHRPIVETYIKSLSPLITAAIEKKTKLAIAYIDGGGQKTARIIWPHDLGFFNGSWFLQAFCETRQALRFFKLTRIRDITLLTDTFDPLLINEADWATVKKERITLEFTRRSLGKVYDFFVEEEIHVLPDNVLVTYSAYSLNDVASYLLGFGSDVTILAPKELITEHRRLINDLQKNYKR